MSEFEVENVLDPKKEWMDDACYRVNKQFNTKKNEISMSTSTSEVQPNVSCKSMPYKDSEDMIECAELSNYDVEVTENFRFRTHICLPSIFFAYIIGTRGFRRKRLEEETKTEIIIPKDAKNNKIVITGATEVSVVLARQKLEAMGNDLRKRHQITHFISFPMVNEQIKLNFQKFKEAVLALEPIDGLDESIFKNANKIHLTIGTLVLLDKTEMDEASKILNDLKRDIIDPQLKGLAPLSIKMKGLDYMNDDPSQVNVLYAKVKIDHSEQPEILQKLSDDIVEYFSKNGLITKTDNHVKLHATLINTRYRKDTNDKDSKSNSRYRKWNRISFDARLIMEKFADFDFGEQILHEIHLSQRFSVDHSGYYEPIHKILIDIL